MIYNDTMSEVKEFLVGDKVFVADEAFCYDYEVGKGFVAKHMFKNTGEVVDVRDEINGEVNFGTNYLVKVGNSMQWVAEECLIESE